MSECEVCGPCNIVYRNGPKGMVVQWRCWEHLEDKWRKEVRPETKELCDLIGGESHE